MSLPGLGAALSIGGNIAGAFGSRGAAKRKIQATNEAIGEVQGARDRSIGRLDPYESAGSESIESLLAALGIGGRVDNYQNPMLQQIQQQSMQQNLNRASATGRAGTSDMADITAKSMLQPAYQMQQNRMAGLQNLFNAGSSIATNQGKMDMNSASSLADLLLGRGEAKAMKSAAPWLAAQGAFNSGAQYLGYDGGGVK